MFSKEIADISTLAESAATRLALSQLDTVVLLEAIAAALDLSHTDTASLQGAVQSASGKQLTDDSVLGESATTNLELSRLETVVLLEAIVAALGVSRTDTARLQEAVRKGTDQGPTDAVVLGESVTANLELPREDASSLREATSTTLDVSPGGTAVLDESLKSSVSGGLTDMASVAEEVKLTVQPGTANLGVTKVDSPDPVLLEQELTYTLTVTNKGPATGTGVTVVDTLPPGVTFVSASAGCRESQDTVTCALDPIASGDTATLTIIVIPTAIGDLSNTAVVTGNVADLDTGDNTTSQTTTVNSAADVSVTKSGSPDPVLLDSTLTYTLTVVNKGPSVAIGTTLVDTLPSSVSFVSASAGCNEASGTVTCTVGTVASGDSATVSIAVSATTLNPITNTVRVTSNHGDPNTGDNTTTETTSVNPAADLSVTKADSPDPVLLGSDLTYSLTVTNKGPSEATGVTLTDTLPAGVSFLSASPGCLEAGGTVRCVIGTLPTGDSSTVSIIVRTTAVSTISNTGTAAANEGDSRPVDNDATATTRVNPAADLVLTKADSPDPVLLGGNLTYTLTVSNRGPSEATGVTLTDTLQGVSFLSASAGCSQAEGTVICAMGVLDGASSSTVRVTVVAASTGDLSNTANVTSGTADPNTGDNTVTETTFVGSAADLVLSKTDAPDPVLLGERLTYTLAVTNQGPSYDATVTLVDTLPSGVTFISSPRTKARVSALPP